MIKITNCFKIEPDIDKVSQEEWHDCAQEGKVDLSYIKSRINLQDEGALELSLRFRDDAAKQNLECQLSAVSAGNSGVINTLQTLAALGFTRTDRVAMEEEFNPFRVGSYLADYIMGNEKQDIIICGSQSGTGSNRAVPLSISEKLGIPAITNVTDFKLIDQDTLEVKYQMDSVNIKAKVKMPVVLAIGDVQQSYLRVPTLKQRMASAAQTVGEFVPETLSGNADSTQVPKDSELVGFKYMDRSRDAVLIDGSDSAEAAKIIYDRLKQEGMVE